MCEQEPIKQGYRLRETETGVLHDITYEQHGFPCWRSFLHTSRGNVVCYPRNDRSERENELCVPYFETEPVLHEDELGKTWFKYKYSLTLNGLTGDFPLVREFISEPLFTTDDIPQDEDEREELFQKLRNIHNKLLEEINKVWRERSWYIRSLYDVKEDAARPGHDEMVALRNDYYRFRREWGERMEREMDKYRNNPSWLETLKQVHDAGLHQSAHAYTQDSGLPRLDINIPLARKLTESLQGEFIAAKRNLFFTDNDIEGISEDLLENIVWLYDSFGPVSLKANLPKQGWIYHSTRWITRIDPRKLISKLEWEKATHGYHFSEEGQELIKKLMTEDKEFTTFGFEERDKGIHLHSARLECEELEEDYRFTAAITMDNWNLPGASSFSYLSSCSFIDKHEIIEKHGPGGYIKFHLFLTCMFRLYPLAPFQYLHENEYGRDDKKILQKMTDRSLELFNILTEDGKKPNGWKYVAGKHISREDIKNLPVNILPIEEHPELKIFEL